MTSAPQENAALDREFPTAVVAGGDADVIEVLPTEDAGSWSTSMHSPTALWTVR